MKTLAIFSVFVLLLNACSEEIKPTAYDYTHVFTGDNSKTWRLDRLVLREAGENDDVLSLNTCERDDQYIFYNNAERLFEVTNGNSRCDSDEPDLLVSYVWAFNNSGATLSMVTPHIFGNFIVPFIVREVNKNEMELEIFLNEKNTISYVLFLKVVDEN